MTHVLQIILEYNTKIAKQTVINKKLNARLENYQYKDITLALKIHIYHCSGNIIIKKKKPTQ